MITLALVCLLARPVQPVHKAPTRPATTQQIVNTASIEYTDATGRSHEGVSNTVRTDVLVTIAANIRR